MGSKAPNTVDPEVAVTKNGIFPSPIALSTRRSSSAGIICPLSIRQKCGLADKSVSRVNERRLLLIAGNADAIVRAQAGRGRRGHH